MSNHEVTLTPYLHFQGNCEEALKTYEKILGGKIESLNRFGSAQMEVPESHKNQVLHALFRFGDNSIMASDTIPGPPLERGSNYALTLSFKDEEKALRTFNELANDGQIIMPFEKQFWGAFFGQLEDRFGIRWMVDCEG